MRRKRLPFFRMHCKYLHAYFFIMVLFALIILPGCSSSKTTIIQADKGIINLTQWDFNKDGNIKLDGQWEFYWNKLITYSDIKGGIDAAHIMADVPKAWTEDNASEQILPGQGYGTYRLHVKTSLPANSLLSFNVNTFSSAYKLYVNDLEVASNGTVGVTKQQYKPEFKPLTVVFNTPANEFDILIQVANFDISKGGFWNSLSMGSVNGIADLQDLLMGKELFIVGALVILALYYFCIYFLEE